MTSEDEPSLSEDEMDVIASRVAEKLQRSADDQADGGESAGSGEEPDEPDPESTAERREHEQFVEEAKEAARQARESAMDDAREARRAARESRGEREGDWDDFGDRIERSVELSLHGLADKLERALGTPAAPTPPAAPGIHIGPGDSQEKAVYKTQLQKGGRVAVPDTEIESLDLEPGDTLQVVLYKVE